MKDSLTVVSVAGQMTWSVLLQLLVSFGQQAYALLYKDWWLEPVRLPRPGRLRWQAQECKIVRGLAQLKLSSWGFKAFEAVVCEWMLASGRVTLASQQHIQTANTIGLH